MMGVCVPNVVRLLIVLRRFAASEVLLYMGTSAWPTVEVILTFLARFNNLLTHVTIPLFNFMSDKVRFVCYNTMAVSF